MEVIQAPSAIHSQSMVYDRDLVMLLAACLLLQIFQFSQPHTANSLMDKYLYEYRTDFIIGHHINTLRTQNSEDLGLPAEARLYFHIPQ